MTLSKTESVWIEDDRGASNIWVLFVEKSLEGSGVAKDKGERARILYKFDVVG